MAKICALCDKQIVWPDIFNCFYCQKQYCPEHSQPENHECPKVSAAKHIKGDYLRERGVNITSGRYRVECKIHGFITDYFEIETANQKRIEHLRKNQCPSQEVWLRQHTEDRQTDIEFAKNNSPQQKEADNWMYECLAEAKSIIKKYHTDYDTKAFFEQTTYELYIQNDRQDAYAYISLHGGSHFPIGVHPILSENNAQNQKMLVIVLVHELLHAIHPNDADWPHSRIYNEEDRLANLACYFDALVEIRNLAISGRMRFCDI